MHQSEKYVGVIGGRDCPPRALEDAYSIGQLIARAGWVLVCGGMGGIMENACRGAVEQGGTTLGILPASSRTAGNPYLSYSIVTGLGEGRNLLVVKSSQVIIALAGSFGTLSEIALARLNGVPVVGLHTWQLDNPAGAGEPLLSAHADNVEQAIQLAGRLLASCN